MFEFMRLIQGKIKFKIEKLKRYGAHKLELHSIDRDNTGIMFKL
jgi:hypothetical protein